MIDKIPKAVIKKLRKILALAADRSTTSEEAQSANQMAKDLLARHGLTLSEFLTHVEEIDVIEYDLTDPRGSRAFGNWQRILIANMSNVFGVYAFKTKHGLRVIGRKENTMRTVHYFEYLKQEITRRSDYNWTRRRSLLLQDHFGKYLLESKRYGVIWKNNFHIGAVMILNDRVREMFGMNPTNEADDIESPAQRRPVPQRENSPRDTRAESVPEQSVALSRMDTETKGEIQKYIDQKYQTDKQADITMTLDRDGLAQGKLAGRAIPLYHGVEQGKAQEQLHAASR